MEYGKFIIAGEDKKTLTTIKNALSSNGHTFIGYTKDSRNILKHVRSCSPEFVILEVCNNFKDLRDILAIMDEELLASVILVLDSRADEAIEFVRTSRIMTYITKPVFDENVIQIVDLTLINYKRVMDYEGKVRKLNDTLESRKIVERAKWLLIEKEGMTETEAYEAIKKKSRDNRMPMREIAEAIIITRE